MKKLKTDYRKVRIRMGRLAAEDQFGSILTRA